MRMKGKAHILCKRITMALIVLIMGSLLLNQVLYTHTHVLPDGSIVSHSHPFDKAQESKQAGSHQHSTLELFLLQNLQLLFAAVLVSLVLLRSTSTTYFRVRAIVRSLPILLPVSPGRAPPVCM